MTLCVGLQAIWMLTLEPECLKPIDHHSTKIISDGTRRSSCLRFHFVGVEVLSFLPHS
jgi:hypothetical protein